MNWSVIRMMCVRLILIMIFPGVLGGCSRAGSGDVNAAVQTSGAAELIGTAGANAKPGGEVISTDPAPAMMTPVKAKETEAEQEIKPTPITISGQIGTATPALKPEGERTKYQLEATLDYRGHRLEVREVIDYLNMTGERISYVEMVVEAQRYPGTFRLKAIYDDKGKRIFQYQLKDTTLTIRLPKEAEPGATAQFSLEYSLQLLEVNKLPQLRPYPLGYTSLQTNFGDWYPFIPPYKAGQGWLVHPPATYGEHLVYDPADFEVAIRATGADPGLVFAASAPEQVDGEWRRFELEAGRSFAWSVSPNYQVVTDTIALWSGENTVISSYYFPLHAEAGKDLLEAMVQAMEVYSRVFGAFPQPSLAGVQADFMDGMEYDGLFFLSTDFYNWHQGGEADFLAALAAHETAHQWWYRFVGNDQALEPWLDEALCTYSEKIFYETYYPGSLDWWWTYRVNYYEPEGNVGMQIYDAPQTVGQYREYRDPVYLRGALFLEELRGVMGDEAFFTGLRAYVKRYAYGLGEGDGFWEVMEAQRSADLAPIQAKYFKSSE